MGAHSGQDGFTRVVGQAPGLAVKAEPPLPPGLDAPAHLHQGPAAAAPRHLDIWAVFGVVAPAFQVLLEIQDPGYRWAGREHGWGLGEKKRGQLRAQGQGEILKPGAHRRSRQSSSLLLTAFKQ